MPKKLEKALYRKANSHKRWSRKRKNAYVFGTMRKLGWKPKRER